MKTLQNVHVKGVTWRQEYMNGSQRLVTWSEFVNSLMLTLMEIGWNQEVSCMGNMFEHLEKYYYQWQ